MELVINTAYSEIELYLFDKQKKSKTKYSINSINDHTRKLYELYENLLAEQNLTSKEFTRIYVVTGPGSYTGLRIGVVFAKTLAMIYKISIVPLNLLEMLYCTNEKQNIALDARGGKWFVFDGEKITIQTTDDLGLGEYLVDPKVNYLKIDEYLEFQQEIPYLEIKINYLKKVL